ncbi:MAG: hypothetical protein FWF95_05145 [Syntrophorhabdaceae bacterium]|nr:hypothetical protein [Syntrophorhabdaceae bacterium]
MGYNRLNKKEISGRKQGRLFELPWFKTPRKLQIRGAKYRYVIEENIAARREAMASPRGSVLAGEDFEAKDADHENQWKPVAGKTCNRCFARDGSGAYRGVQAKKQPGNGIIGFSLS